MNRNLCDNDADAIKVRSSRQLLKSSLAALACVGTEERLTDCPTSNVKCTKRTHVEVECSTKSIYDYYFQFM